MTMWNGLSGLLFVVLGAVTAFAEQQTAVKVTPLLQTTLTVTGQTLKFPNRPQVTATLVEIPAGADVGWHEHPNLRYVYVIDGTLTIEMANNARQVFPAGTIFVEATGTRHHGMNQGATPVKVLFIDHSEEGQSNMVKTEAPSSRDGGSSPDAGH